MKKFLTFKNTKIRLILYFSLKYFITLLTLVLIASITLYYFQKSNKLKYFKMSAKHNTEMAQLSINRSLDSVFSELRILGELDVLKDILDNKTDENIHALNRTIFLFSKNKKVPSLILISPFYE